jgi:hypothetical protein
MARGHLQLVGDVEDVRRQALEAREVGRDRDHGILEVHCDAALQKVRF